MTQAQRHTSRTIRAKALMALAIVPLVVCRPAAAGPREDSARAETARATTAYNLGHFDEAARRYEEAYRLIQDPALLFNLGQSYRLGGQPQKALSAYRAYLRTSPPSAANRGQVEKRIAEIEKLVATQAAPLSPAGLAGADLGAAARGGPPDGRSPAAAPSLPAPAAPGPDADMRLATAPESAPDRAAGPTRWKWWVWALAGVAAVTLGVTALALSSSPGTDVPRTPLGNRDIFR